MTSFIIILVMIKMKKIKIFLGDLVHTWEKVSLWTMPLNIGYIATYAQKMLPIEVDVRLFKRPELMIPAIKEEKPNVVGLSHYVWNDNLNKLIFKITKSHAPECLTVGGGPIFTNANALDDVARNFYIQTPDCDAFVLNQGERGFVELLTRFLDCNGNMENLRDQAIDGCMINDIKTSGRVHMGEALSPIRDLDEIPSPYLSGLMDEFFNEPFVPIIETNRSCPYRCTFCAWGIGTGKLAQFSDDRVFSEIKYLGERDPESANMFIADANFSILERDEKIATALKKSSEETGYPGHVGVQWNKTRPDRVLRVARALGTLGEVGASMQSLDEAVLQTIKRKNLPIDTVADMMATLRDEGIHSALFSELIIGLPNETRQGHIDANKKLMELGTEVFNYNLHLLPGTEMDSRESRANYFKRTGWRLHDNAFGIYDGIKVFEGQEVVQETNTMSFDDLRSFRFIHFLIQFMWGRKWYFDYLHLLKHAGIHPIDMIVRLAENFRTDDGEMGELYQRFDSDHRLENFETSDELVAYWSKDSNLERLRSGNYGKLNYLYTYEILLEHYDAFNAFLLVQSKELLPSLNLKDSVSFLEQCEEILAFSRALRVTLTRDLGNVVTSKCQSFSYDLLAWRKKGYQGAPTRISTSDRYEYEFFLEERQQNILGKQLSQFRSSNLNQTLRKMSEEVSANEFFYHVRKLA